LNLSQRPSSIQDTTKDTDSLLTSLQEEVITDPNSASQPVAIESNVVQPKPEDQTKKEEDQVPNEGKEQENKGEAKEIPEPTIENTEEAEIAEPKPIETTEEDKVSSTCYNLFFYVLHYI
jgi:hypothetical protein